MEGGSGGWREGGGLEGGDGGGGGGWLTDQCTTLRRGRGGRSTCGVLFY